MNIQAYNLLPNHFHLIGKVNSLSGLEEYYRQIKPRGELTSKRAPGFVMQQFSNLLNGYCKAYNKRFKRMGSLFIPTRRVQVETAAQFRRTCRYVHNNAVRHRIVEDPFQWPWSSLHAYYGAGDAFLDKATTLRMFHGMEHFDDFHRQTSKVL